MRSNTVTARLVRVVAVAALAALVLVGCDSTSPGRPASPSAAQSAPGTAQSAPGTSQSAPATGTLPSGSALADVPAGEQRLTVTVAGETRHLVIERPSAGAHRRPLIIFLHGSRGSGQEIRDTLDMDPQAATAGVLLVFPDGDPQKDSWRSGCCNANAPDADFQFIAKIINILVADGEADPAHVVLGGFSAGAFLVHSFACRMPQLIRAAVSVSGSLLLPPVFLPPNNASTTPRCAPSRPVTVVEVHGASDPTVPVAGTCRQSPCVPGVGGVIPSAETVNGWWRQLDHCGAPTIHDVGADSTSLASCAAGTQVGLALVKGAVHDLTQLRTDFPLRETMIELALGQPLTSW